MSPVDPTSGLGTEPITPPPGVKLDTPEQEQLYRASLEFERFFVQQMLKPMQDAGKMFSDDGEGGGASGISGYQDMAQDQMTQSILDGGGLGMAATLYGQMAEQMGFLDTATSSTGSDAPKDGGVADAPVGSTPAPSVLPAGGVA